MNPAVQRKILPYSFYIQDTTTVAKNLLGKIMVFEGNEGLVSGKVVETEAYLGINDPSCHSARGKNRRNAVMFGPSGHAYIYLIYGMYLCFNVTSGPEGSPEAVLIRALEPLEGIDIMCKNRGQDSIYNLCSGPGKLVQALGIDMSLNGISVVEGRVKFLEQPSPEPFCIVQTTRIGISKAADWPLRFYIKGSKFVSKK
ncbi:MAG: DNA-3-methyladenine glycosylase [Bacillota bacterium]|jgi:DNA-3-methyladenine glycosylase